MLAPRGTALPKLERCLAELLRTCVHPPSLVLRVEHVFGQAHAGSRRNAVDDRDDERDETPVTGDDHGIDSAAREPDTWSFRFAASDGHLQIQAVLAPTLLRVKELRDLQRGDVIEVRRFQVRSAPRLSGKGRVVYLGIRDCAWVGRDREPVETSEGEDQLELEGGFLREEHDDMFRKKPHPQRKDLSSASGGSASKKRDIRDRDDRAPGSRSAQSKPKSSKPTQKVSRNMSEDDSDDEHGFDTIFVSQSRLEQRREALRQIQQPPPMEEATVSRPRPHGNGNQEETQDNEDDYERQAVREADAFNTHNPLNVPHHQPTDIARSTTFSAPPVPQDDDPRTRLTNLASISPIDSLASLLALPHQKSYSCTVLALISWVSPSLIHRPNTPFPPKRHIKIHDPSITHRTSGVTVSVFVDAQKFLPAVGTVALFRGLVMHRLRRSSADGEADVILNKYPPKTGSQRAEGEGSLESAAGGIRDQHPEGDGDEQEEWFISDEARLVAMGFDVQRIKAWWEQRLVARKGK
ncbi:hypothetical protein AYO21_05851 [Fonsecaea monophora]|uniref:Uncharacterized protein n=1 Tax=Fonsecaea monophora TaxID=254056 RepID=A0A177F6Y4_9EURO|nr:hypothetical protein AYO21_05851 [Fonsecaea monophora]KAH0844816.1 hypothetical protein FOPE_09515 [Fonsecaea pedrosoi]OAG39978.1 hypothetical protein AYO21_05851 [Fonsecaea monophora]